MYTKKWEVEDPKAIVVIIHGMAEHILRYDHFAKYLNSNKYLVFGYDQIGHGRTVNSIDELGYLGEDGWNNMVLDVKKYVEQMKEYHLPIILLGHSMGSFIVREFASRYSELIDGLILSGTGTGQGFKANALIGLEKLSIKLHGDKKPANFVNNFTKNMFLKKIKNPKYDCDWISSDDKVVEEYHNDELCGTIFPNSFYYEMLKAVERVNNIKNIDSVRDIPILIFSGEDDPVGDYSKGVLEVYSKFKRNHKNVTLKLYKGRHEMLNEVNKEDVYKDILEWIEKI